MSSFHDVGELADIRAGQALPLRGGWAVPMPVAHVAARTLDDATSNHGLRKVDAYAVY